MSFNPNNYKVLAGMHNGKQVLWIQFPKNVVLSEQLKSVCKPKWSASEKCWYVWDIDAHRQIFGIVAKSIGKEALNKIDEINMPAMKKLVDELRLKGYSSNTIKTYSTEFAQLLYVLKTTPVDTLTEERLRSYFLYCIEKLKISDNHLHSRINAIKFYFEKVLKHPEMFFDIPRPKKPSILPKVLSKNDILKIFDATDNIKHKLMLQLSYGMGLRVSEIVNLKIADIDSSRMQVLVEHAKGKKDRYVNLPETVLPLLRDYYKEYKPKEYLFEGQYGKYSTRSVQLVFKKALNDARIKKKIGIHGLRHSYATHLLEYGTDISYIQKLLGHNDIKTTLGYTHVSKVQIKNVKSPLDL